jgi:nucleotide-binding universal stress UspA family protein
MDQPLVVGVDGSASSLTAVDWAVDEAARHGLPLRLVHGSLWERYEGALPPGDFPPGPLSGPLPGPSAGQEAAGIVVAAAAERARRRDPALKVFAEVVPEEPADALLRAGHDAFAVVTGSRGRGELTGLLLGSVGLAVAARAHCPVVVVRGDRAGLTGGHERILLGAGDPATGGEAARFAYREASARGCALDAVRAWRRPAHDSAERAAYHQERASAVLQALLHEAADGNPGVRVCRATVEGPARKVLLNRSAAADLVIIGAQRRYGHFGLQLGRVGHALLHHAYCPVAVVPQLM